MEREWNGGDITSCVWIPEGHEDAARQVLDLIPDEWEKVIATPAFKKAITTDADGDKCSVDVGYYGMAFMFVKDGHYCEIGVKRPGDLLRHPYLLQNYLSKVRNSLAEQKEG